MKKILSAALALAMVLSLLPAAFAAGGTAYASTQAVEVDGKKVEFQMYALKDANGNPTNYVKLRDVAHVLNGTRAQFAVGYDGTISVTTGTAYTDVGGEMTTPYSGDRTYRDGSGAVKVNGQAASLESIILTDDAGGDYTYFKLRDLGTALGFKVDWSADRGVFLETGGSTQPTVPSQPESKEFTLENMQGIWHCEGSVDAPNVKFSGDIIISGDKLEAYGYFPASSSRYYHIFGTITGLQTDFEGWVTPFDSFQYPYFIFWTGTKQKLKDNGWEMTSEDITVTKDDFGDGIAITSMDPAGNNFECSLFFDGGGWKYRYEKVSSASVRDTVMTAINEADAKNPYNKYPTYVKFKGVPDFGAIFNLPDHANHEKLDYMSGIDPTWIDYINSLNDKISSKSDITVYLYRTGDAGGYDKLLELENQYVQILKECGFMPEIANTAIGGSNLYYTNKSQGVSVSLDWKEKSEEQYFPSDLYVTVQSKR